MVKNLPANAGDAGTVSGLGRSTGEGSGNPLTILAWRKPWTEKSSRLQSMGSLKCQTQFSYSTTTTPESYLIKHLASHSYCKQTENIGHIFQTSWDNFCSLSIITALLCPVQLLEMSL